MPVAGVIAVLAAGRAELGSVTWPLLLIMLALALLHPVLPFSLELLALRRLTATAFGTLMSLEPAIALLAGLLLLGQLPGIASGFGVLLVVMAGIGATRAGARAPAPPDDRDPGPAGGDAVGLALGGSMAEDRGQEELAVQLVDGGGVCATTVAIRGIPPGSPVPPD